MCHVVKTSSWLVCCKKKLKNIILTGNLTWNWCLSFGICQYYSRNMFHCRASWDYDPFTQLVRIPQIHSTLFAAVWEFGASSQKPHHGLYSISIFIKAKTWIWSPKGLVTDSTRQIGFGEEWYVQQRNPGRTMVLVFFCGFFLSQHGASNEVCHESWKLIERPLSYARFEFLPIKRGTKWKGPALVQPISSTASGV